MKCRAHCTIDFDIDEDFDAVIEIIHAEIETLHLIRIVVGVDPAVTSNPDSSETGIVVVGKAADGHCYVLGDFSVQGSPLEWATATDRARRIHAERLRQIRQEQYAAKEQERAKVEEAQYRDRTVIPPEGDDSV